MSDSLAPRHPIDVVIPVYDAYAELTSCVETVRHHGPRGDFRVILIDDASPDPRIGRYFDLLAEEGDPSLLLLRNSENRGFSGTANRGMSASDERDVVLLNSDTVVTAGWLEKIRRCADSDPRIGTITPFSNNATICSFPKFGEAVSVSTLPPVEMVNRAIEDAAIPCYPDLPCAVGFCMFIRRDVIRTIGLLDAETFGRGFGEDNDYSMRVARAGYRNVLCDDTFVAHTGSSSFGDAKDALLKLNTQRLVTRYPEYPELVRAFIADNPVRAIITVAAIRLACIEGAGKPGVVHILHGEPGGGTRSHVQDLVRAGSHRLRQYLLVATGSEWTLEVMDGHGDPIRLPLRRGDGESWADVLDDVFSFLEIDLCHVHEISTARDGLLQALASLQVPYGVTLHNYYLACPTTTLLDGAGEYCGAQTDNGLCQGCLQERPQFRGIAIADWRNQHAALLKRARFVVAPARAAADTLRRYFPDLCIRVIPHGVGRAEIRGQGQVTREILVLPTDGKEAVGVLGAISPAKGARRLDRLVARTRERNLPLRWVLVGYFMDASGRDRPWQDSDRTLSVHGPYQVGDLGGLLDRYGIRFVVFPAAWPETFSYTLSEAWALGRPALVPPLGALGERVKESGAGWVMDDSRDEDRILDQIMGIRAPANSATFDEAAKRAREFPQSSLEKMAEATAALYGDVAPASARRRPASPTPKARACFYAAVKREVPTISSVPPRSRFTQGQLPGRNDPCPCGSTKRYKSCCGALGVGTESAAVSSQVVLEEALRRHQAGKLTEAQSLYEKVLEIDPENAFATHYLGMIRWHGGDAASAEAMVRRSITRAPEIPDFHNNLGLCLSSQWRHDEAIAAYRKALEIRPDYAQAHNNLGLGLQAIRDLSGAVASFRRAIELAPEFAEARWNLEVAMRSWEHGG